MNVSEFARTFPKGMPVNFFSVSGRRTGKPRLVVIRSRPWLLLDGHMVVLVKGITGAVSCDAIECVTTRPVTNGKA